MFHRCRLGRCRAGEGGQGVVIIGFCGTDAIDHPCDGIGNIITVELGLEGYVARDCIQRLVPTTESISLAVVIWMRGGSAAVVRHGSIGHTGVGFQYITIVVDPCDGVLVNGSAVVGLIHYISGHGIKPCHRSRGTRSVLLPSGEGVGILRISRFSGIPAGGLAVVCHGGSTKQCPVILQPGDRVASQDRFVLRGVGHISGNRGGSGRPTGKHIVVLGGRCLGGSVAVVLRGGAIGYVGVSFHGFSCTLVLPNHRVSVDGAGVAGLERKIAPHDLLTRVGNGLVYIALHMPTDKGAGVLRIILCRSQSGGSACPAKDGSAAVIHIVSFQNGSAVFIIPSHGILVYSGSELRNIDHVAGNIGDCRRPAIEGVSILVGSCLGGGGAAVVTIFGSGSVRNTVVHFEDFAVPILPRDGVFVDLTGVGCGVGCIAGDGGNGGSPTGKGIGVLAGGVGLSGCCTVIRGCSSVVHVLVNFQRCVDTFVFPRDGVDSAHVIELGGISYISGNGNHLLVPPRERVGELIGRCLFGSCAVVDGNSTVRNIFVGFQRRTVMVLPDDVVAAQNGSISCLVGGVACDGDNGCIPPCEGVGVLGILFLGRIGALVVGGSCAVSHFRIDFQYGAILVYPGDGVGFDGGVELGGIGSRSGDRNNRGRPSVVEDVGVLGRGRLGGSCTIVAGRCAVSHLPTLQNLTVAIQPNNGIAAEDGGKLGGKGCGPLNCRDGFLRVQRVTTIFFPAGKDVGVLVIGCLDGGCTVVGRSLPVGHIGVGFQHRAIVVLPGDGIGAKNRRIGGLIGGRAGDLNHFGIPTLEGVGILGVSLLGGISRFGRHGTVRDFLFLFQQGAVLVHPGDGVGFDGGVKLGSIGGITDNRHNGGRPSFVGVGVLDSGRLGGSFTRVGRSLAVPHCIGLQRVAVSVHPCDGVFPGCVELGFGCCPSGDGGNGVSVFIHPTGKGVTGTGGGVLPGTAVLQGSLVAPGVGIHRHAGNLHILVGAKVLQIVLDREGLGLQRGGQDLRLT